MKLECLSDTLKFTLRFFSKPRFTGSIMPSSSFLGKAMVECAKLQNDKIVIELGSGTGPITKQILNSGVPPKNLYCVEFDRQMCEILKRKFPEINIINDSAENLSKYFEKESKSVCTIISSLPLLSLPSELVENILNECENTLESKGRFVQFTYNLNRRPERLGFKNSKHVQTKKIFLNIPPARVDSFEKI